MNVKSKFPDVRVWLIGGIVAGAVPIGMIGVALESIPVTIICASIGSVLGAVIGAWCWLEMTEEHHD